MASLGNRKALTCIYRQVRINPMMKLYHLFCVSVSWECRGTCGTNRGGRHGGSYTWRRPVPFAYYRRESNAATIYCSFSWKSYLEITMKHYNWNEFYNNSRSWNSAYRRNMARRDLLLSKSWRSEYIISPSIWLADCWSFEI